jgi:hypothetical protein
MRFVRSAGALIAILALALSYMRLTRRPASIQRVEYATATLAFLSQQGL